MTGRKRYQARSAHRPARRLTLIRWLTLATLLTLGLALNSRPAQAESARADDPARANACRDELWMISTRRLGCPAGGNAAPELQVKQCLPDRGWTRSSLQELLAPPPPQLLNVIYVHGNRISSEQAVDRARQLRRNLSQGDSRPIRMVVWSWPSGRIFGLRKDVQIKARRTLSESYYLSWFLQRYATEGEVSLVGYSFGARIITGALHMLDGGVLAGRQIADRMTRRPVRVVLMAAAVHDHWLLPGRYHGKAATQIDAMLNLFNPCDPALKRYRFVDRCGSPTALGFKGASGSQLLRQQGLELEQRNAACLVGRSHNVLRYLHAPGVMRHVRRFALWRPLQTEVASTQTADTAAAGD
jgi:hypothetical protein